MNFRELLRENEVPKKVEPKKESPKEEKSSEEIEEERVAAIIELRIDLKDAESDSEKEAIQKKIDTLLKDGDEKSSEEKSKKSKKEDKEDSDKKDNKKEEE